MVLDQFRLGNRLVVVTGGAGMLGVQHCEALLDAGARVVALDVNENNLRNLQHKWNSQYSNRAQEAPAFLGMMCNISNEQEVRAALQEIETIFGQPPNILINNAAIDSKFDKKRQASKGRLEQYRVEDWNLEIAVGLTGAFICAKVFGSKMAQKKDGLILNIASDLGLIGPDQRLYRESSEGEQRVKPVTYSVVKHGLIGLTRYLATYWAESGVRCNAFAPGGMFNGHSGDFVSRISKLIPMGRMAKHGEYQAAIVFLCSMASSYMNGAILCMDGGRTTW